MRLYELSVHHLNYIVLCSYKCVMLSIIHLNNPYRPLAEVNFTKEDDARSLLISAAHGELFANDRIHRPTTHSSLPCYQINYLKSAVVRMESC